MIFSDVLVFVSWNLSDVFSESFSYFLNDRFTWQILLINKTIPRKFEWIYFHVKYKSSIQYGLNFETDFIKTLSHIWPKFNMGVSKNIKLKPISNFIRSIRYDTVETFKTYFPGHFQNGNTNKQNRIQKLHETHIKFSTFQNIFYTHNIYLYCGIVCVSNITKLFLI